MSRGGLLNWFRQKPENRGYEAMHNRINLGKELADARIRVRAIESQMRHPRTNRSQRQRLDWALEGAKVYQAKLEKEYEHAVVKEHEEDVQRTIGEI